MTVVAATAKSQLQARLNSVATPIDPDLQAAICEAISNWLVVDVMPVMQVTGATGTGTPGGPLPIALAPGSVT